MVDVKDLVVRCAVWALLAVVFAVPLDALHVWSGVIVPARPGFDVAAVPLFGAGAIAMGLGHRGLALPLGALASAQRTMPVSTGWAACLGGAAFVMSYASSSALAHTPIVALLTDVALWSVIVARVDGRARAALVIFSLGAALLGPAFESALASSGAFAYAAPDFAGVPLWLPGIYLNAGAAVHLVDRYLLARRAPPTLARPAQLLHACR